LQKNALQRIEEFLTRNRQHRTWKKFVGALACGVVMGTACALILPAVTLEEEPRCGKIEHTHTEACYTGSAVDVPTEAGIQIQEGLVLSCGLEEHSHSAACSEIGLPAALPGQQGAEEQEDRGETYSVVMNDSSVATDFNVSGSAIRKDEAIEQKLTAYFGPTEDGKSRVITDYRLYRFQLKKDKEDYVQPEGTDEPRWIQVEYTKDKGIPFEEEKDKLYVLNLHEGSPDSQETVIKDYTGYVKYSVAGKSICTSVAYQTNTKDHPYDASDVIAFVVVRKEEEKLEDLGVYPTLEPEDESRTKWVVYDTGDAATANVKATITLTGDSEPLKNCYPFISEVKPGEEFYPDDDTVRRAVGKFNDVQCYKIHWVEIKEDGTYNFNTGMELGNGKDSEITLEYLKDDAQLKGVKGGRKLRVFSSKSTDGKTLVEISNSVQNVQLMDKNYKGFAFKVTEPCPYVFVSEYVEQGYVSELKITKLVDGSAPFDVKGDLVNDTDGQVDHPGSDRNDDNRVVRSYDTIQYNLSAAFGAREDGVTKKNVNMYFELTLGKSVTAARFDISKMLWLGNNYSVEYLDADENVIMVQNNQGKFFEPKKNSDGSIYRDINGFAQPDSKKPVKLNAQLNGSTNGKDSYKVESGGVVKQRLVGFTELVAKEGESILSGTQDFTAAITVRNADNGEIFTPSFKMWLEDNEENYGPETKKDGVMLPAQVVDTNVLDISEKENEKYRVTVSAGTSFNLQIKKNTDMSYKNWFDFSTGQLVKQETRIELDRLANLKPNRGKANPAEFVVDEKGTPLSEALKKEYANYRYGRLTCYGIALQLYTDVDEDKEADRVAKGLKGMSLPVGDIQFDLNLWSSANGKDTGQYPAILWDYNENVPANNSYTYTYVDPKRGKVKTPDDGLGNGGRNLFWDGQSRSPYAKGGAPSNYIFYHNGCYYGGDWALVDEKGAKVTDINTVASPGKVTGTGKDTTYHFSVSDYDFDFDDHKFPTEDAGNSGVVTGYDTYARGFSAGCFQVLSVFPRVQEEGSTNLELNIEVNNLKLKTRAGQVLEPREDDKTGYAHEVNKKDNTRKDLVVLYAPGTLTKGSSFNGKYKNDAPNNTSQGFLGTDYWTTNYDCSTFAGDNIWLMGYGMIAADSDYRMRSMNLLQLFDSRALRIRETPEVIWDYDQNYDKKGDVRYLYAADPDHPEGYDTNKPEIMKYMNTVREEDLVYSTVMPNNDGDIKVNVDGTMKSMKCIGVLMEIRHCDLLGGRYQYLRIPVKVNGDEADLVGKTVATVNAFRVWSYDLVDDKNQSYTWADGIWDSKAGKNKLEGYKVPDNREYDNGTERRYSGQLVNGLNSSPSNYVKTEYDDGHQVQGTHQGVQLSGNSLLILAYKTHVGITVDYKDTSSGRISYTQSKGETVVDYRINEIEANTLTEVTGKPDTQKTTLTVRTALDENKPADRPEERIFVAGNSYRIEGYAVGPNGEPVNAEIGSDGKPVAEAQSFPITTDADQPTVLAFYGSDGEWYTIKVYARSENRQSVEFVIEDAPVDIRLPDITFQANFSPVTQLKDNDTITTNVYISGAGDKRAYDIAKGNVSNIPVGIVLGGGTNLTKAVDKKYIELNDLITYTVTYTNSGDNTIPTMYFYDLLPKPNDIRGSKYQGTVGLRHMDVKTEGTGENAAAAVYYSTTEYQKLYDTVKVFGGKMKADGTVKDPNAQNVETMLESGKNTKGEKLFQPLGSVSANGKFEYDTAFKKMTDKDKEELMSQITGLYVKAEKLNTRQSIIMTFTLKTEGNQADDGYRNIANSWIVDGGVGPLTSNRVETSVISRRIAGAVWYDRNLNGIRDDGEPLLEGVKATLFKKQVDPNNQVTWVKCDQDVTGEAMKHTVTTDENGEYRFEKLAAGEYIVAFSRDRLKDYTGAASYQVNGKNDAKTNDGMEISSMASGGLTEGQIKDGGYAYYIKYSNTSDLIPLHSLNEIVSLQNGVEAVDDQDLGVVIAGPKLPMTGGSGTAGYILGGLFLMAGAVLFLVWRRKRHAV